jgi:hypothetical protein
MYGVVPFPECTAQRCEPLTPRPHGTASRVVTLHGPQGIRPSGYSADDHGSPSTQPTRLRRTAGMVTSATTFKRLWSWRLLVLEEG